VNHKPRWQARVRSVVLKGAVSVRATLVEDNSKQTVENIQDCYTRSDRLFKILQFAIDMTDRLKTGW